LKNINRHILIFFVCLLLPSSSLLSQWNWQQLGDSHFIIFFQPEDIKNAQAILEKLVSIYPEISSQIGGTLQDSVFVFIASSEKHYRQIVGTDFPRWSQGLASPTRNIIILKSPRILPEYADPDKIAIHELTHILLNKAVKNNPVPRWFNEGLAVYYSGEKKFASSSLISKALISKSIIPLDEIEAVLKFHQDKAQLAYQESYTAVRFLFEHFGSQSVKKIIFKFSQGKSLDQALQETIGLDGYDFEHEWFQYIKKKYRWHFLLDFDVYLWIFMLIIFLIGFLAMRRRNKLTLKRWKQEEDQEELW